MSSSINNPQSPLVLLTRPRYESLKLQRILQKKKYKAIQAPLLTIKPLLQKPNDLELPANIQGWIFSSSNGVLHAIRVFSQDPTFSTIWKHQTALAIGHMTSETLKNNGFSNIITASQHDSPGLFSLALEQFSPERGIILHPTSTHQTSNLAQSLKEEGLDVRKITLYNTKALHKLPYHVSNSLSNGLISHVMLFSSRTAEIFNKLIHQDDLKEHTSSMTCLCLSNDIVDEIKNLPWNDIKVATSPHHQNMIDLLPPQNF